MEVIGWKKVIKKYQKVLGKDMGTLHAHLTAEVLDLNYKWNEFVVLFGTNQERIDVLNKSANQFWANIHNVLFDDILLHIARLTDKDLTFKKKNLSVQGLLSISANKKFDSRLKKSIEKVVKDAKFCRDWRNRRIAHIDYEYRTNDKEKLARATRAKVSKCIKGIHDILNLVEKQFFDSEITSDAPSINGALDLLFVIDDGLRFSDDREARLRAGTALPQDYQDPKRSWV